MMNPAGVGLPERIVVTRSFTYITEWAMEDVENEGIEPTRDAVIEHVSSLVEMDMSSPLSRHEVVWTDENGDYIHD